MVGAQWIREGILEAMVEARRPVKEAVTVVHIRREVNLAHNFRSVDKTVGRFGRT
jgi:hypothetical protein